MKHGYYSNETRVLPVDPRPPLIIQIRQRDELGVVRPRRISLLLLPRLPRPRHKPPNARKRRGWDTRQPVRAAAGASAGASSVPEPGAHTTTGSSGRGLRLLLLGRMPVLGVFGDEEHPVGGDGDDDHRDGGFDLEPEDDPGGVDLAVDDVAAADSDDADDHGEDAEAEDGAEC